MIVDKFNSDLFSKSPHRIASHRIFSLLSLKVCRKIGEKMRLPPSEQNEHVLIAIYARPSAGGAPPPSSSSHAATEKDALGGVAAGAAANGGGGATGLHKSKVDRVEGGIAEKRERRREAMSSRTGRCEE